MKCWIRSARLTVRELCWVFVRKCECEIPGVSLIETLRMPPEQNEKIVGQIWQSYTCVRTADYTVGYLWMKPKNKDFIHLHISLMHSQITFVIPDRVRHIIQTDPFLFLSYLWICQPHKKRSSSFCSVTTLQPSPFWLMKVPCLQAPLLHSREPSLEPAIYHLTVGRTHSS